jgi:hypothetical protein
MTIASSESACNLVDFKAFSHQFCPHSNSSRTTAVSVNARAGDTKKPQAAPASRPQILKLKRYS